MMRISNVTLVVRDYDEALAFYVGKLGFTCLEDTPLGDGKRWVRVGPAARGPSLLLARAVTDEQQASVGRQTGGRVGFFLQTDDLRRDHATLTARGVVFVRPPADEPYGSVAVFEDLYGNRFDLVQPTPLQALRDTLALAPPPPPEAVPVTTRVLETRDDYTITRFEYPGDEGDVIPALYYAPAGAGPFAAVLIHHQNNSEFHLGKIEVAGLAGSPYQAFAPQLARRGIAVLVPDVLTFEERRKGSGQGTERHPRDWTQHYNEMAYRLVRGDLVMSKLMSDALRALTVLAAQPGVDAGRIGVAGHSMGGSLALYQAALDPRIAFACTSCAATGLEARMARGVGIQMAEVIPDRVGRWTTANLVCEIARRPYLVVSAASDPYSLDVPEVVKAAKEEAERRGLPSHLDHLRVEGEHALDEVRFHHIIEWLAARANEGTAAGESRALSPR
jgi:dienelactone hydrolase/predicted enzyme related to lactoylglutathione lyase